MGGPPEGWTVELCECGGSLCNYTHLPRTAATLNAMGVPPQALPPMVIAEPAAPSNAPSRGPGRPRPNYAGNAAANDGVVARWTGGRPTFSKIIALLAVAALFFLRLSNRRRS